MAPEPVRLTAAWREFREAHPELGAEARGSVLKKYGLTTTQYEALLVEQNGVCRICRRKDKTGKRLSVDHNHRTGKVRGLLCGKCNAAIGHLDDDPARLRAAADYLEKSGA